MCDPVTAVALGAAAAGTGLQVAGQRQSDRAEASAIRNETARQNRIADASRTRLDTTLGQVSQSMSDAEMARATDSRAESMRAASSLPGPGQGYLPGQAAAPQIVRDEIDRQRGLSSMFLNQQAGARANLGGWSDALFNSRVASGRGAQDIGTNASFARGSAGVLPLEMRAAAGRGAGLRTAGNLVAGAGMLAAPWAGGQLSGLFATPQGAIAPSGIYSPMEVRPGGWGGF